MLTPHPRHSSDAAHSYTSSPVSAPSIPLHSAFAKSPFVPRPWQLHCPARSRTRIPVSHGATSYAQHHDIFGTVRNDCFRVEPQHESPPIGSGILPAALGEYRSGLGSPCLCLPFCSPFPFHTLIFPKTFTTHVCLPCSDPSLGFFIPPLPTIASDIVAVL